jgi:hypothetical protein
MKVNKYLYKKGFVVKRILFIIARTIDYRIGLRDNDKPDLPLLTFEEAVISFSLKIFIMAIELATCLAVVANVIHHW